MRIAITGASGRVGGRLSQILATQGHEVLGIVHKDLDITAFEGVTERLLADAPDVVVHCAALTDVDRCAREPEEGLRVNTFGTQNVTLACQQCGAALCYLSTNEVFDGKQDRPYLEYDAPGPINPYGYSKWAAEQIVRDLLPRHYIVRTSWLFAHNGSNFLQRIVGLAREGRPISVVTDEIASPTYTEDLASALAALIMTGRFGTYHLVNEGSASRYDFGRYILDCYGMPDYPIHPITRAQFPRPSHPPTYSALRNFMAAQIGIRLRPWQEAVSAFAARELEATRD